MINISKKDREILSEISYISVLTISNKLVSKIDETTKYLFKLMDGNTIETVVMYYKHGISICISTQVGCRMGCKFCASTLLGLVRNLSSGEILDQIIFASKDIKKRISNIVIMGIGEPLDNYDNVIKFLKNINDENGFNIGYRHISLSTCGLVSNIKRLSSEGMPITLSVSIHSPFENSRSEIMPVNKSNSIKLLIEACRSYVSITKRRITFEYALIHNVNDGEKEAEALSKLIRGILCHINLIPVNEVLETGFKRSENIDKFKNYLEDKGFAVTVRRELGSDILASCGQLRHKSKI